MAAFLRGLVKNIYVEKSKLITFYLIEESNGYDWNQWTDRLIHSLICWSAQHTDGLSQSLGPVPYVCVQSGRLYHAHQTERRRRGGKRGPVRGHVLKQGVQSEGRWREKGGRFGEIGRLGASVRREESWEVQWWSNFCHHWTTQQSPSQWFYSHHAWSHDPRAWCRHRGQTTERQQRHQPTYFFFLLVLWMFVKLNIGQYCHHFYQQVVQMT